MNMKDIVNRTILLQILCVLFGGIAASYYPVAAGLLFLPDLLNVVLLCCITIKIGQCLKVEHFVYLLFLVIVGLSVVWGDQSWKDVFSAGRRYASAFLVYYLASEYLDRKYWEKGIWILLIAQGINVFLTAYQNLVMKLHPDFCNGIFGFTGYDNAIQGIFCLILSIIAMVYFIDAKWSAGKMLYTIGSSCVVCALAEIKAYYVMLAMTFVVAFLFRWKDQALRKRIFRFILIAVAMFAVAYKILELIFPYNLATFFDLSHYILYEQYGARGGAGRLSTVSYVYNNVFRDDVLKILLGCGLGSASNEFAYTIGKMLVSFGTIGMGLFLLWLFLLGIKHIKRINCGSEDIICLIMVIMIFVAMFVWNGVFTQMHFLIFWMLGSYNIDRDLVQKITH